MCRNKQINTTHVYECTAQRFDEIWNSAAFACCKTWLCLEK